jgi:predicted enzyme related to lactoylglutathione lyase
LAFVTHHSRVSMIVLDVPASDHAAEVAFWQAATGVPLTQNPRFPEYHGGMLSEHLGLLVQRLGAGPGRVHIDIHTDDVAAEVARLEDLGAEVIGTEHAWQIMRDPAGLVFCVVPEPHGSFAGSSAHAWD